MENYRSKLRSAKSSLIKEETTVKKEEDSLSNLESPKTPPLRGIEYYFPPSPFGKTRHQSYGDRFIPPRDRSIQLNDTRHNEDEPQQPNVMPVKKITDYFLGEVLPPTHSVSYTHSRGYRRQAAAAAAASSSRLMTNPTLHRRSSHSDVVSLFPPRRSTTDASLSLLKPTHTTVIHDDPAFYSPHASHYQTLPITEVGRRILTSHDNTTQPIKTMPIKTLDAPELVADFYYHLIDWGPDNCVAVGLGSAVYLWNASTSEVIKLCDFVTQIVTTIKWSTVGSLLIIGLKTGRMILYDAVSRTRLRDWSTHLGGYSVSATWKSNIVTSGSRNNIYHHDLRSPDEYFRKLVGHTQQVIGLRWNHEGTLLASGSSDHHLLVWNSHENGIVHDFKDHTAAVRAVTWSPHKRGLLASGGGTEDRTIKLWDTISGRSMGSHDTGSQVCNLEWSKKTDQLVSSHGFATDLASKPNQLTIWKANTMQKVASLEAHSTRVVYMAMSYDGNTVVTGAGDEELRFWDLFSTSPSMKNETGDRKSRIR